MPDNRPEEDPIYEWLRETNDNIPNSTPPEEATNIASAPINSNPPGWTIQYRDVEERMATAYTNGRTFGVTTPPSCPRCGGAECLNGFDICDYCQDDMENEDRSDYEEDDQGRDVSSPIPSFSFVKNPFKRFVGFELEFFYKENTYPRALTSYGSIHGDGSLSINDSHYIPAEFSSCPVQGDGLLSTIEEVTRILAATKCKVNQTCGFHAHFSVSEMSEAQRKNVRDWWMALERVFFTFVPDNRREGAYSKPIRRDTTNQFRTPYNWSHDRYYALNICAYKKWGTYEIRMHQGTLNKEKITSWIMFYLAFFEVFSQIPFSTYRKGRVRKMNDRELLIFIFQQLKCPMSLKKQFVKRIVKYGKKFIFGKRVKDYSEEALKKLSNRDIISRVF